MRICLLFVFCLFLQLDSDGTITIEEQIVLVLKAKVQCELNITAQLQEGGKDAKKIVSSLCSYPSSHEDRKFPSLFSTGETLIRPSMFPCGGVCSRIRVFSSLRPTSFFPAHGRRDLLDLGVWEQQLCKSASSSGLSLGSVCILVYS